jgi:two-component system chemotaxis response regulator CheB
MLFQRQAEHPCTALPAMELVGATHDGVECLEEVARLAPDVLVLDLEMPRMNGLDVLERLRSSRPKMPVIMCSAHTERGAHATFDALARGAADYVMKPTGGCNLDSSLASLARHLLPRIAVFASERGWSAKTFASPLAASRPRFREMPSGHEAAIEVVVIGVSTGGPAALEYVLPRLAEDLPVPVLIVQHMPKLFTSVLAERLNQCSNLRVAEAYHGAPLQAGTVWIAPGDAHMEVATLIGSQDRGGEVRLHSQEPLHHCRPAVDHLFFSSARWYGAGTLAVVLTGMGSDGLDGARAVHERGGVVLAQDRASSAVWGMPGRVIESGLADAVLPLEAIAYEVNRRVKAKHQPRFEGVLPIGPLHSPDPVDPMDPISKQISGVLHGLQ